MRKFTPGMKEVFDRDGFILIEGLLNQQDVNEIETNVERFIGAVVPKLSKADAMYEDYAKPETLKQTGDMNQRDPYFADLLSNPKIVGLAQALLRDEVIPKNVQFFSKPPGVGKATPPHQDGYYFCLEPNEALTVWIALDDIDDENGALHYVKGSHKKGVLPHGASHVLGFSQGLIEGRVTEIGQEVTCRVKRGDCLVHHSLTIHSAGANPSKRPRRAIGMVYFANRAKVDPEAMRRYQESLEAQRKRIGTM
jgi:phytanoyl-CoA hydroxylase